MSVKSLFTAHFRENLAKRSTPSSNHFKNRLTLKRLFRIFEILHHEREPSVAEEVGIADEEEFDLELGGLSELEAFDRAGSDQIAFGPHADGLVELPCLVLDFAGVILVTSTFW